MHSGHVTSRFNFWRLVASRTTYERGPVKGKYLILTGEMALKQKTDKITQSKMMMMMMMMMVILITMKTTMTTATTAMTTATMMMIIMMMTMTMTLMMTTRFQTNSLLNQ